MNEQTLNEVNRCLNCKTKPCQVGCPFSNDIPEVIKLIKEEEYEEAYKILTQTTVLSAVCGRICPHIKQCQGKCTRGIKGDPIEIGNIESWLADLASERNFKLEKLPLYDTMKSKNKKVAVIGGGPAGLTCAAFLARSGVNVDIYEKSDKLGGILSHGIPDFRLDKSVVEDTIKRILDLGISVYLNKKLGENLKLENLIEKYDAIFLGIGANVSTRMNIQGEGLDGVYGANELLEYNTKINYADKNVAVIGGGNVAMDMARTANKNGAKSVTIIYRRAEKQMPSEEKEIQDAKSEGVRFLLQNNIVKILDSDDKKGQVAKIECIKTELIKREGETREVPVNIKESNYMIDMDMVIMAVGSMTDKSVLNKLDLEKDQYGYITTFEKNITSNNKVFAGGDVIGEKSTVAWAARSGRNAADKIIEYLNKEEKQ